MAKKINENELNNISGGCAGDYYKSDLGCFDSDDKRIGSAYHIDSVKTIKEADDLLEKKFAELFAADYNVKYIRWRMFNKFGDTQKTGIKYR